MGRCLVSYARVYGEVGIRAHHLLLDAIRGYPKSVCGGCNRTVLLMHVGDGLRQRPFHALNGGRQPFLVPRPKDPTSITPQEQPLGGGQAIGAFRP
jgi:hypothetical protein